MAFPEKFRHLIDISAADVELPDYLWLTYAVCAIEPDSCGWGGWMLEVAFKKTAERHPTSTGDKALNAIDQQICPICRKTLFRTEVTRRFEQA